MRLLGVGHIRMFVVNAVNQPLCVGDFCVWGIFVFVFFALNHDKWVGEYRDALG